MILMFSLLWFSLQICRELFCENLVHTSFPEDQAATIFRVQPCFSKRLVFTSRTVLYQNSIVWVLYLSSSPSSLPPPPPPLPPPPPPSPPSPLSLSSLPHDSFIAFSKTSFSGSAICCFLSRFPLSSCFLKLIQ